MQLVSHKEKQRAGKQRQNFVSIGRSCFQSRWLSEWVTWELWYEHKRGRKLKKKNKGMMDTIGVS